MSHLSESTCDPCLPSTNSGNYLISNNFPSIIIHKFYGKKTRLLLGRVAGVLGQYNRFGLFESCRLRELLEVAESSLLSADEYEMMHSDGKVTISLM
jgi:hypothetical protein